MRRTLAMDYASITPAGIAWAAGFFEGEGSLVNGTKGESPTLQIGQKEQEPLLLFQKSIGGIGLFYTQQRNGAPYHTLRVQRFEHVQQLVVLMWPWLSSRRRQQAIAMLTRHAIRIRYGREGAPA